MSVKPFILLCCCLLLIATGCRSQTETTQQSTSTTQQSSSTQTAAANANNGPAVAQSVEVNQNVPSLNSNTNATQTGQSFDPCSLITRSEIESVQGERVEETKASPGNSKRLAVAQCFYQTTTPSKSVSLEVTHRLSGQPGALSPREFWEQRFERADRDRERERGREGKREADKRDARAKEEDEEEEEGPPPRRIAGVGEEAYWAGNPMIGALYVLKGDAIIRISIGGVADQNVRLAKTKNLAQMALKRLNN